MTEYGLVAFFVVFSCLAMVFALYPLRRKKGIVLVVAPVLLGIIALSYWNWGSNALLRAYVLQTKQTERVAAMLRSVKGPGDLILQLKARLRQEPKSAKGWYLLGRLHSSQNQWKLAFKAFKRAYQLQPDDPMFAINYAQSLLFEQSPTFEAQGRIVLNRVLKKNPKQPDALALFAMDAYTHKDFQKAIRYWQRLLILLPSQSDEAISIRKAILKAKKQGTAS